MKTEDKNDHLLMVKYDQIQKKIITGYYTVELSAEWDISGYLYGASNVLDRKIAAHRTSVQD